VRVVLDTNVLVSALLFTQGRLSWIRRLWTDRTIVPLVDEPCTKELLRVLTYPRFGLSTAEITILLESFLPYAETVDTTAAQGLDLPTCRDTSDQKFLRMAQAGNAAVLVTGDEDLLILAQRTEFPIERPSDFARRF